MEYVCIYLHYVISWAEDLISCQTIRRYIDVLCTRTTNNAAGKREHQKNTNAEWCSNIIDDFKGITYAKEFEHDGNNNFVVTMYI